MRPTALDVYWNDYLVGTLYDAAPLSFEYALEWLARETPMAIAGIPLQTTVQAGDSVQAFFENLLPEGELRQHLIAQRHASTLFALLAEVAGDTAGGFVLVPAGTLPVAPSYTPTTWAAIADALRGSAGSPSLAAIDLHGEGARVSLAGAQDKTTIALFDDGIPHLPNTASASTHILKPNIRRLAKVWHSAANEAIIMRTAAHLGLPTAQIFYGPLTQACVAERFDRVRQKDGKLSRLVQYDFCQLASKTSDKKYEREGGPGLAQCAELIRQFSAQPALDLRNFADWIWFNLYTGNNDSHAKNLSLYSVPGEGVKLTPFYDLMCTRLYPGLSQEFAFSIGGEFNPGAMRREHIQSQATALGMRPAFFVQRGARLARQIPDALQRADGEIRPLLSPSAKNLATRLRQFVESTTTKLALRLT